MEVDGFVRKGAEHKKEATIEISLLDLPSRKERAQRCPECKKITMHVTANGIRRCGECNTFFTNRNSTETIK